MPGFRIDRHGEVWIAYVNGAEVIDCVSPGGSIVRSRRSGRRWRSSLEWQGIPATVARGRMRSFSGEAEAVRFILELDGPNEGG